ncbi:mitochondrial fission factor isoform X8 [Pelobates cultripes]|uniref:Mitochondrial fission factor isoform X8 n=1 Tax=Pelobates cultripes TaxID=61616 RepID=A0AAD1VQR9_PELCU|nr:mitochondrial fission factor isoform X8 [Pelobates cultripes]
MCVVEATLLYPKGQRCDFQFQPPCQICVLRYDSPPSSHRYFPPGWFLRVPLFPPLSPPSVGDGSSLSNGPGQRSISPQLEWTSDPRFPSKSGSEPKCHPPHSLCHPPVGYMSACFENLCALQPSAWDLAGFQFNCAEKILETERALSPKKALIASTISVSATSNPANLNLNTTLQKTSPFTCTVSPESASPIDGQRRHLPSPSPWGNSTSGFPGRRHVTPRSPSSCVRRPVRRFAGTCGARRGSRLMSRSDYPTPAAEMAEMNRMQYEIEYTEGISQRMRVPEKLKVAPSTSETGSRAHPDISVHGHAMQVPERIVVAGQNEDSSFSRPSDLDLIQTTPFELLALKTPPRVLTLSERPLDFLDLERPTPATPQQEELRSIGRLKRERSASENMARQNGQLVRHDSMPILRGGSAASVSAAHLENARAAVSSLDSTMEATPDDMNSVDATSLRRQIIKLNRRLLLLEEENKERVKREMIMYSITVAFWLLNSWFWFRR